MLFVLHDLGIFNCISCNGWSEDVGSH